jgi:hypothetical protein
MNDRPDAAELLAIARETLLGRLLTALPEESRYDALMIANAMAIAARELEAGDIAEQSELARLNALYAESSNDVSGNALHSTLVDYNRRLAADIRDGRFDDKLRVALLDHLEKTAVDKLAVANPKALKS